MSQTLISALACGFLLSLPPTLDKKFDYESQVGIVELSIGGGGCLTIKNVTLNEEQSLDLIIVNKPQVHSTAIIEKKLAKPCPHDTALEPADSTYQLRIPPKLAEKGTIGFGVAGFSGEFILRDGLIRTDLNQDGTQDSFRSCASMEGLHLTVWHGDPFKGSRKWHRYYYLGYDLEPDCTEKDY